LDGDWVEQLHIDPAWTGRGLGTRLLALVPYQATFAL
jgi:GNAT superfamily N-acetyltransferase